MKKRLIFFSLVIIAVVVVVLLITTKISNHSDEVAAVKKMEINREQRKEDLPPEEKQPAAGKKYVEGEALVKFKKGITNEEIKAFLSDYNLKVLDVIKGINVFRLKTPENAPLEEILDKLNKDSRTEYAEPNYIFKIN